MSADVFALPAFILSIVSLAVAAVGAVTGVVALVWQVVTRTRGAHRIRVRATSDLVILTDTGERVGPYVEITIINQGASAVQLHNWSIEMGDGNGLIVIPALFPPSPKLPHMLQPGTSVSFLVLSSALADAVGERDVSRLRPKLISPQVRSSEDNAGRSSFSRAS